MATINSTVVAMQKKRRICQPSLAKARGGITLIEMLVTIGMIAILSAILIPVVGTVRNKAKQAQCTSNLRQVFVCMQLYANDNDGYLPAASRPTDLSLPTSESPTSRWPRDLEAFLPQTIRGLGVSSLWENEIFICPSAITREGKAGGAHVRIAYNATAALYGNDGTSRFVPRLLSEIVSPAVTPLVYDGQLGPRFDAQTNYYANWSQINSDRSAQTQDMQYLSFRHNDRMNVLMADGNVESVDSHWLNTLNENRWKGIR